MAVAYCNVQSFFFICASFVLVTSDNGKGNSRSPRLFTFNTMDENINVNLEFSIPFITIPTKKAMETTVGVWTGIPSININPTTLAVGAAAVLGTTILAPILLKGYAHHYPQQRFSKLLDSTEFSTDAVIDFTNQMLSDNRGVRGCTLRLACWTAQRATKADPMWMWNQIMRNSFISTLLNTTAIEDAMFSGREGRDCMRYTPCPVRDEHIPILLNSLSIFTNSVGQP